MKDIFFKRQNIRKNKQVVFLKFQWYKRHFATSSLFLLTLGDITAWNLPLILLSETKQSLQDYSRRMVYKMHSDFSIGRDIVSKIQGA